jgi:hypothetical protein
MPVPRVADRPFYRGRDIIAAIGGTPEPQHSPEPQPRPARPPRPETVPTLSELLIAQTKQWQKIEAALLSARLLVDACEKNRGDGVDWEDVDEAYYAANEGGF